MGGFFIREFSYILWVTLVGHIDPIILVALNPIPLGVDYAMTYPAIQVAALSDVEEDKSGLASGLLFASFRIGGIVFVALLAILISLLAAVGPKTATVRQQAYQTAE